ncbi:MAG: hypothetical protein A3D31_02055 [Candidatus Fluviicola riflensis]|nr:MAG: hypothetical protein CHH17_12980 [Candidatus Fluviicola riflensis]OGS78780.1 MAG: hypothetical protein A3D31_02055 [Candidatus Fluviicola riflensis]OGS86211.1 MAG: hypothetical protein A2724_01510 [Fluviicola sp. RIFCSPHIGHO2_01_FULL_43_53]OGS87653.1 MAG: hypothetical protein A3E30_16315 [Fluviicola sp. RIFCSPHIGHO2_12_FULL_43_24]
MTRIQTSFLCGLALSVSAAVNAQTDSTQIKAVQKTVMQLFDGMRKGDSTMVKTAFVENPGLSTTYVDPQGIPQVERGSFKGFLMGVGTPHDEIWDEHLLSIEIKVDDGIAEVWGPYVFYLGKQRLHCGVNSFQLVKTANGWKILSLVDSHREENCGD